MIQTPNYKFMQLEQAEQFQYDVVNQNFANLDSLLKSNFDSITTELGKKMDKSGGTFTGPIIVGEKIVLKNGDVSKTVSLATSGDINVDANIISSGQVHGTTLYEGTTALSNKYAALSHTHAYLPTSGGTISGSLTVTGTITQAGTTLANTYAPKSHTHDYLPLTGGTVTGATTFSSTLTVSGNTTLNGEVYIASGKWIRSQGNTGWYCQTHNGGWYMSDTTYVRSYANKAIYTGGNINCGGTITGTKVYNAVWNDYAEFFPRGEETEAGDIIMLDLSSNDEKYIKAHRSSGKCVPVGVHSDTYGHIVGGDETPDEFTDYIEYNMPKYIPVGLAGRVNVKFIGTARRGEKVVPSDFPGVGRLFNAALDKEDHVIGVLVEADNLKDEIRRLKMRIL